MSSPAASLSVSPSAPGAVVVARTRAIALAGLYLHAAFLSISIAGMQIGLIVAAFALFSLAVRGERVWFRSALDLPILALLGVVLFWPWDTGIGTKIYRTFLSPFIILSVLGLQRETMRRDALRLLAVWAAFALIPGVLAWFQYFHGVDLLYELGMRREAIRPTIPLYRDRFAAAGFFTWYIRLAHNLTPPLCLLAAITFLGLPDAPKRTKRLGALATAIIAAAVFLTFTRTAWYGLVVAAVILAAFAGKRVFWTSFASLAVIASLLFALQPGFRARVLSSLSGGANQDRMMIWETCQAVAADHALVGIGFGNMPTVGLPYFEEIAPKSHIKAWCHNTFFTSYVEGGIPYLAATVFLWAWLGWFFFRRQSKEDPLGRAACAGGLAALAAMGVNAMAHDIFYASETMYGFGFLLALAVACTRHESDAPAPDARA